MPLKTMFKLFITQHRWRYFMNETNLPATACKKSQKPRIITAIVYVIVWIVLCSLKWVVPDGYGALGFDAVFCAISILGSMEFLRAIGGVSSPQKAFTIAFAAMVVPFYVLMEEIMGLGLIAVLCAFVFYVMCLMATSVFDPFRSTVKGTITCIFCMLYCGILSTVLAAINHLEHNSMAGILMLFMATTMCDSFAFIFGSLLKRVFPWKLSPKLSPNKTIVGAIGGLIGGIVGGVCAFVLIHYLGGYNGVVLTFTNDAIPPIVAFILVGLATAVLAQVGDLFESAIKRECGIKDMGKLLPGHGGVLDRFDSMLYCSVLVLLCFGIFI